MKSKYIIYILIAITLMLYLCVWLYKDFSYCSSVRQYVYDLSFSPDGSMIAVMPSFILWNYKDGNIVNSYSRLPGCDMYGTKLISFSKDGNFYSISESPSPHTKSIISLFELPSNKLYYSFRGYSAIFANNSEYLIYVDDQSQIVVFNIKSREISNEIILHDLPSGRYLLLTPITNSEKIPMFVSVDNPSVCYDSTAQMTLKIWDINSRHPLREYPVSIRGDCSKMVSVKENIYILGFQESIKINLQQGTSEPAKIGNRGSYIEAISENGEMVAFYDFNKRGESEIKVWDTSKNQMMCEIPRWSRLQSGGAMAFSPDAGILATGSTCSYPRNGEVRLFDVFSGKLIKKLKPPIRWQ